MNQAEEKPIELLVEIRTEDMPPVDLTEAFASSLGIAMLKQHYELLIDKSHQQVIWTPRRFGVGASAKPLAKPMRGPAVAYAYQDDGRPSKALEGFMRILDAKQDELNTETHKGKEYKVFYPKRDLRKDIGKILEDALLGMVLPRKMRWSSEGSSYSFVRRITGATVFVDDKFIETEVFGRKTLPNIGGHRFFESKESTKLAASGLEGYVDKLEAQGVIGRFHDRKNSIIGMVDAWLKKLQVENHTKDFPLIEKLASMCEHPAGIECTFDNKYLDLPPALINAIGRKHLNAYTTREKNSFLFIADRMRLEKPLKNQIRKGVENVMRARLDDALFLFEQDRKLSEEQLLSELGNISYVTGLGSMSKRCVRIEKLAIEASEMMGLDPSQTRTLAKAAQLCKADLGTQLVNELPELEGQIVGSILTDKRLAAPLRLVATHLDRSNDRSHSKKRACLVLAVELERMVANVAVRNMRSTGAGDRTGIRRSAMRIDLTLFNHAQEFKGDFYRLIDLAFELVSEDVEPGFFKKEKFADAKLYLRNLLGNSLPDMLMQSHLGIDREHNDAAVVLAKKISLLADPSDQNSKLIVSDLLKRYVSIGLYANEGAGLENIEKICAAVKRLSNIAKKSNNKDTVDENLLVEDAERNLHEACKELKDDCDKFQKDGKYKEMLAASYKIVSEVDKFFNDVMVNVDEDKIKRNRHALVSMAHDQMLRISA